MVLPRGWKPRSPLRRISSLFTRYDHTITPENVSRGRSAQEELSFSPRPGAPMGSPVALSRVRTITTIDIKCNDRSSADLEKAMYIKLVALTLHRRCRTMVECYTSVS